MKVVEHTGIWINYQIYLVVARNRIEYPLFHMPKYTQRTWVLIRGLMHEAEHWGVFIDRLKQTFPQDTVLCPDLPGAGIYWKQDSPTSVSDIARKVREDVLAQSPADADFFILSLSLGGMVAAEWISQDPARIKAVIVMNTSSRGLSHIFKRLRLMSLLRFMSLIFAPSMERKVAITLMQTSNNQTAQKSALESWIDINRKRPMSVKNILRQLFAASKFKIQKLPPSLPALVLASNKDRLVNVACSEDLRDYWKSDLIYHPTAGHDISLDDPEWICRTVEDWLNLVSLHQK